MRYFYAFWDAMTGYLDRYPKTFRLFMLITLAALIATIYFHGGN